MSGEGQIVVPAVEMNERTRELLEKARRESVKNQRWISVPDEEASPVGRLKLELVAARDALRMELILRSELVARVVAVLGEEEAKRQVLDPLWAIARLMDGRVSRVLGPDMAEASAAATWPKDRREPECGALNHDGKLRCQLKPGHGMGRHIEHRRGLLQWIEER